MCSSQAIWARTEHARESKELVGFNDANTCAYSFTPRHAAVSGIANLRAMRWGNHERCVAAGWIGGNAVTALCRPQSERSMEWRRRYSG